MMDESKASPSTPGGGGGGLDDDKANMSRVSMFVAGRLKHKVAHVKEVVKLEQAMESCSVLVAARVRPPNQREKDAASGVCVEIKNQKTLAISEHEHGAGPTEFSYDQVIGEDSSQREVYDLTASLVRLSDILRLIDPHYCERLARFISIRFCC